MFRSLPVTGFRHAESQHFDAPSTRQDLRRQTASGALILLSFTKRRNEFALNATNPGI